MSSHYWLRLSSLALLMLFVAAILAACAPAKGDPRAPGLGQPVSAGVVFAGGQYLAAPYKVELKELDILVNGVVASAGPKATDPVDSLEPAPAAPKGASDLTLMAAHFLSERKIERNEQITPQLRAELAARLKSFPTAANVVDEESSIVVTDTAGRVGRVHLLSKPGPTLEAVREGQRGLAQQWNQTLQAGGGLLVAADTVIQVAPAQIASFFNNLTEALKQSDPIGSINKLVNSPSLASALAAAGAPPASLQQRLPTPRPSQPAPPAARAPGGALFAPLPDTASHRNSHTPTSASAVMLHTLNNTSETAKVAEAARLHGYNVSYFTKGYGLGSGGVTIDRFLVLSGNVGLLYIDAHGDRNSVSLEQWRREGDRDRAYEAYLARGIPVETGVVWSPVALFGLAVTYNYTVDINRKTIATWKGSQTILQLSTCDGFFLGDAFRAVGVREFIAPPVSVNARHAEAFNTVFWPNLAGTLNDGRKRNVIDAYNASPPNTVYRHNGEGLTVLSPAVAHYEPANGTTVVVGQEVKARILFDAPMDTQYIPVWDLAGSCNPLFYWGPITQPNRIGWRNDRTFEFSFLPRQPGEISVDVGGGIGIAQGKENRVGLDGNQDPAGSDHVGPNTDTFKWNLKCVTVGGTVTPSVTARPTPTPPPTATATIPPPSTPTVPPPTATRTATATATATATTRPNQAPSVSAFQALFVPEERATRYRVTASDPDGDLLSYQWSKSNPCGTFSSSPISPEAVWGHPHPPCPEEPFHSGTVTVIVNDGQGGVVRCEYTRGSDSGNLAMCQRVP